MFELSEFTLKVPLNESNRIRLYVFTHLLHHGQVVKKQLYFKQFTLAYKTVLFRTIQFSISTQFKFHNSSISSSSV